MSPPLQSWAAMAKGSRSARSSNARKASFQNGIPLATRGSPGNSPSAAPHSSSKQPRQFPCETGKPPLKSGRADPSAALVAALSIAASSHLSPKGSNVTDARTSLLAPSLPPAIVNHTTAGVSASPPAIDPASPTSLREELAMITEPKPSMPTSRHVMHSWWALPHDSGLEGKYLHTP